MRTRNDKLETMLLERQEKLSVFVAANDGRELRAAQVFTGESHFFLGVVPQSVFINWYMKIDCLFSNFSGAL